MTTLREQLESETQTIIDSLGFRFEQRVYHPDDICDYVRDVIQKAITSPALINRVCELARESVLVEVEEDGFEVRRERTPSEILEIIRKELQ